MKAWPKEAVKKLKAAHSLFVLTGAGVSAASGIATFRDAGGLWENVKPEDVATPEAFARDPERVWRWYDARRRRVLQAQPNAAHRVLAWLETQAPRFCLATQNVDGLHQAAGSRGVLELHGNLWLVRCTQGCGEWEDRHELADFPYRCPHCKALARPGVVWFGEALDAGVFEKAEQEAMRADAALVIGTSSLVYPAAGLIDRLLERDALVVEINPEKTPFSGIVTVSLREKAEDALEALKKAWSFAP